MAGGAEGAVSHVAAETGGVHCCPAPEAPPVLQSAKRNVIPLIEVPDKGEGKASRAMQAGMLLSLASTTEVALQKVQMLALPVSG